MQLKSQFKTNKKRLPLYHFLFCKMKELSNSLPMIGSLVSNNDFVMQVLNRFPFEYDDVVATINSCLSIELQEVQSLIVNQETRIK